jgi:hypothetical protein
MALVLPLYTMKPQPSPVTFVGLTTQTSAYVIRTSEVFGTSAAPVTHRAE